jgi:serine/threonine-protein kinase
MKDETGEAHADRVAEALKGRYDIERVLGQGGMAVVFLARDTKLNRPVAVKVLHPSVCSKVGAQRFLREVQITAPLQHPNILPLIDSGTVEEIVFSVMPYVEGDTVRDRLLRGGPLAVEDALLYAREVAEALEYAHRRGIVHRDIKPENILISNGAAVISDFGIARAQNMAGESTLTSGGVPIGTPAYMSPEQITGREKVDGRADVYSLGCTLHEMLAGRPPFQGPEVHDVLRAHLEQEPPALERARPELGDRVVALVRKAMAKRPADRFQSAGEMAAELRLILGEPPRQPTPPDPGALVSSSGVRRPRPSYLRPSRAGGWLLLAALAFGALALVVLLRRGDRAATTATSLAVLPFATEPPGSVPEYVGEGLEDELILRLGRRDGLRVLAATSSRMVGRSGLAPQQIAETLGVGRLMTGVLAPLPDSTLRVTVRLTDAGGGTTWQRQYRMRHGDARALANEIAEDAAVELVGGRRARITADGGAGTISDALLEGRYWLARPAPVSVRKARTAYESVLANDPANVEALAGLSRAHHQLAIYGFRGTDDLYGSLAQSLDLARRAVALDTADADAMLALARASHHAGIAPDSIARIYRRALALSPNLPEALLDLAHLEAEMGRPDTAMGLGRQALALDPLSPSIRHSTITLALGAREYPQALEWARARLAQDPNDLVAVALEGYALLLSGRSRECADRDHGPWLAAQAACLFAAGRQPEAARIADSLQHMLEREAYVTVHQFTDLATYHATAGNAAEALRWVERAAAHGPIIFDWYFTSGLYDRVRHDPAFAEGLARTRRQIVDRIRARLGMLDNRAG